MSNQDWPKWLPIRTDLAELSPYGAPQIEVDVRLNTNENPYPLSSELQDALLNELSRTLQDLNRYPDRDAIELRSALAESINRKHATGFDEDSIWVANGSNEIIQSILLAFEGSALGFEPSYSMHPLISRVVGKSWISIARETNFGIGPSQIDVATSNESAKIYFITTPNNPTGNATSIEKIEDIAKRVSSRSGLVVVDEAYAEFASGPSAVELISSNPNILVIRTMSKAFAFAGARLGYLIAHPKVIEAMLLVRLPYHLSSLTQAGARAAIANQDSLTKDVERIKIAREQIVEELLKLGLQVVPSDANFLLFTGFPGESADLWQKLLDKGILIRDVGLPGYLRVTIGTEQENRAFLAAIKEVIRG